MGFKEVIGGIGPPIRADKNEDTAPFVRFVVLHAAAAGGRVIGPPYPAASGSDGISRASWGLRNELR